MNARIAEILKGCERILRLYGEKDDVVGPPVGFGGRRSAGKANALLAIRTAQQQSVLRDRFKLPAAGDTGDLLACRGEASSDDAADGAHSQNNDAHGVS
jgi:hypothetical protein